MRVPNRRAVVGSLVLSLCSLGASAASIQWSGGTGGGASSVWTTNVNWFPTQVPASNDVAVFGTTGSAGIVGINMSGMTGIVRVGSIVLVGTTNRTIENSSTTSNGVVQLIGVDGVVISNGSSTAGLNFRNGATNVTLRLQLGTNGEIHVAAGGLVTATNVAIGQTNGTWGIIKSGGGTLLLGATNVYGGTTIISNGPNSQTAGAINLLSYQALGTGPVAFSNDTSSTPLYFTPAAGSGTLANAISFPSTAAAITNRLLAGSANTFMATLSGVISGGDAAQTLQIENDNATDQGRIRFSNAGNTFRAGLINLNRGGLVVDSDGALGNTNNTLRLDVTSFDPTTGLILNNNMTLPASRTMFVASMTRLDVQGFNATVQGVITNNAPLRKAGTGTLTLNGVVSGTGGFTIDAGTLVLNTANSLTGVHTNAATLALGVDGALGSGTLDLRGAASITRSADASTRTITNNVNLATDTTLGAAGTGDLIFNGASLDNGGGAKRIAVSNAVTTINNNINNAGAVTKAGPGRLTLGSPNALRGAVTVAEGTLALGPVASISFAPSIAVSSGAVFDVAAVSGGFSLNGASNQILQGNGTVSGTVSVTAGSSVHPGTPTSAGVLTMAGSLLMDGGVTNIFNLTNNTAIAGGNDLLTVNGAAFEPQGARVRIVQLAPLSTGSYRLVNYTGVKGSTFTTPVLGQTTRGTWTLDETTPGQINLLVTGATNLALKWTADVSGDWDLGTGNWTDTASLLNDRFYDYDDVLFNDEGGDSNVVNLIGTLRPTTVTVNSSSNYLFTGSGLLADAPAATLALTKDGSGMLTLVTTNTYSGGTVISGGTLRVGAGGASGLIGSGPAAISSGATLMYHRSDTGVAPMILTNVFTGNGTLLFMGVTQANASAYQPNGTSTFAGTIRVSAAKLQPLSAAALGGATIDVVAGSGALDGGQLLMAGTYTQAITMAGIGFMDSATNHGAIRLRTGAVAAGPITLTNNARIGSFDGEGGTVSGVISGPYELEIFGRNTASANIFAPTGPQNYAQTRVSGSGQVIAGNTNAFSAGPLVLNGGVLKLNGNNLSFANLSSVTASGNVQNGHASLPATITVGSDNLDTTFSSTLMNGGTGVLSVTKLGNGTLTLTGTNVASGVYTIQSGAIALGASGSLAATSSVTLAGGVLDVVAKSPYVAPHPLRGSGTVSGSVNIVAASVIQPGGAGAPGTITFAQNLGIATTFTNVFDLTNAVTAGAGINDLIAIGGNLDASNSVIAINALAPLANGTYTLFTYGGTKGSGFNPAVAGNGSRKTWTLDETAPGLVNLTVAGGYASLVWRPQADGNWDLAASNWLNTGSSTTDRFYQADAVLFDDSGAYSNVVSLTTTLGPSSLVVNASSNYTLTGTGRITGNVGLLKQGSGTLTLGTPNDFNGTVSVEAGLLKIGHTNALGSTNGATVVASGATVDLMSLPLMGTRERFVVSGSGYGGTGAVISTAGNQPNAMAFLTLAADASLGAWLTSDRWDLRGPGGTGTGELNLNGFTASKIGPGRLSVIDSIITNAGSIWVRQGMQEFSRNTMSGPGVVRMDPGTILFFENYTAGSMTKDIVMDNAQLTNNTALVIGSAVLLSNANTISLSGNLTVTNVVSGPGSLIKTGASTLQLNLDNTYAGGTLISAGTLILGTGGVAGAVIGPITNNGTLRYARSDAFTLANAITGGGNLDVNVAGGMTVDGTAGINIGGLLQVPASATGNMTMAAGADVRCSQFLVGNQGGWPGVITQTGGDLFTMQVRVGHWPNETSLYTMAAGTVSVTNETATNPFTTGATEPNGAFYIGTDGQGMFYQSGGQVRAGGLVLDNRGDTFGSDTYVFEGGRFTLGRWGIQGNTSSVILAGGGTFGAYTNWAATRPMQLTGTNGSTFFDTAGWAVTLSNALSGAGGLVKTGAGVLVLSASNTFAGTTFVISGSLYGTGSVDSAVFVGNGGGLGPTALGSPTSTFTMFSSATLSNGALVTAWLRGTSPTLRVVGNLNTEPSTVVHVLPVGALSTGTNVLIDYDAAFNGSLSDFTLLAVPNGSQGQLVQNVGNGSIDLVVSNLGSGIKWDGGVNGTWKTLGAQNWKSISFGNATAFSALDNVLFDDSATANFTVDMAEVVIPSSIVVSNVTQNYTFTGAGIGGGIGLTKLGAAGLSLFANNVFTGTTLVQGGTVSIAADTGLGAAPGTAITNQLRLFDGTTLEIVSNATVSANRGIQIGPASNAGFAAISTPAGVTATVASIIANAPGATGGLTKAGSGTLVLSAANTFSGGVNVNGGTLAASTGANRLNTLGTVAVAGGATYDLGGQNQALVGLTSLGTVTGSAGTLSLQMPGGITNQIDGVIAGAMGLTKNTNGTFSGAFGGGTLILNGTNTFGGLVDIVAGPVIVRNSQSLGSGPKQVNVSNGTAGRPTITFDGSQGDITVPSNITFNLSNASGTMTNSAGNNTILGRVNLTGGGGDTVINVAGGTLTLSGEVGFVQSNRSFVIGGSATGYVRGTIMSGADTNTGVTKNGPGTWVFTGTNTYRGGTFITAGTLQVGDGGLGGTLSTNNVTNNATLVFNLAGTSSVPNRIEGVGTLVKRGPGVVVLDRANIYTGPTIVSNGTLLVQGSLATGLVTVAPAGTLGGTGTIGGSVSSVGTVAPGASAGKLLISGSYTQAASATLAIEIGGTNAGVTHDWLDVTGAATMDGALSVSLINGFIPTTNDQFVVFSAGSLSGGFASTNLPALSGGNGWKVDYLGNAVMLSVTNGAPPATGYDLAATVITNGLTGYQDDADGDGYANLLEYVTGGSLTNAGNEAKMQGTRTNGLLALRFNRDTNAIDATIVVEGSGSAANSATWLGIATNIGGSWGAATNVVSAGTNSPLSETVYDADSGTNRFLRLRVTRP